MLPSQLHRGNVSAQLDWSQFRQHGRHKQASDLLAMLADSRNDELNGHHVLIVEVHVDDEDALIGQVFNINIVNLRGATVVHRYERNLLLLRQQRAEHAAAASHADHDVVAANLLLNDALAALNKVGEDLGVAQLWER